MGMRGPCAIHCHISYPGCDLRPNPNQGTAIVAGSADYPSLLYGMMRAFVLMPAVSAIAAAAT